MYVLIVRIVRDTYDEKKPLNERWSMGKPGNVYPLGIYKQIDEVERAIGYLRKTKQVDNLEVQVGYLILQEIEIDQLMQDYGALYGLFYPETITGIREGVKPIELKNLPQFLNITKARIKKIEK
jgi:hypothetical protein